MASAVALAEVAGDAVERGRGGVRDRAGVEVGLGHAVARAAARGLAGGEADVGRVAVDGDPVVGHREGAPERDVAAVGDGVLVGDGLVEHAEGVARGDGLLEREGGVWATGTLALVVSGAAPGAEALALLAMRPASTSAWRTVSATSRTQSVPGATSEQSVASPVRSSATCTSSVTLPLLVAARPACHRG